MSKKSALPQARHHVMIYDEDWEFLQQQFGPGSKSEIGVGTAIKTIIHAKVMDMKAKQQEQFDRIRADMKRTAGSDSFRSDGKATGEDP